MAQGGVLLTREPAPQAVPVSELPLKVHEAALNTGPDSSCGLATAGFRSARYLPEEWHQHNYARYHQAFADRDASERCRHESQGLAAHTAALAQRTQQDATATLGRRLQDIHFWKAELQRAVEELVAETDLLAAQKVRLERALDATEVPAAIATDNLQCRERRQPPDLVRDQVEVELLKEVELIRNVQELLKRTLMQAVNQMQLNRDHKQTCEMDWSDKVETYNIDDKCGRYNNQSTNIQFHPSSSKFEESASTPETWAKFSHDNIYRAERERLASINLRSLIDNILHDTAEDLHLQCAAVDAAFAKRCEEMEDAKHKLEHHLRKTLKEIGDQENNIAALKQAIKDKEAPMKVAQTRLYDRSFRPNVDLCRDPAQFRLISEVEELTESIESLKQKLLEAEQSLRNLEDTRMSLEKEIAVRNLEQQNKVLETQLKLLKEKDQYKSNIGEIMAHSSQNLKHQVETLSQDQSKLRAELDHMQALLEELKNRYEEEISRRNHLENEFVVTKKDLDDLYLQKVDIESKLESITDEINYLKRLFDEEIRELQSQIQNTLVTVEMDNGRELEMKQVLEEVKAQYQAVAAKSREEAEQWYKHKFDDMANQARQRNEETKSIKAEIADLNRYAQRLNGDIEALKNQRANLESAVALAEEQGEEAVRGTRDTIRELEEALRRAKQDMACKVREYQELMNIKLALDIEIATYRKLLEGEENRMISHGPNLQISALDKLTGPLPLQAVLSSPGRATTPPRPEPTSSHKRPLLIKTVETRDGKVLSETSRFSED